MSIKVGDQIPEENLVVMTEKDGPQGFSLREYCKEKKNSFNWFARSIYSYMS